MRNETNTRFQELPKFTVLMAVYFREKPEYLEDSLKSILVNQSIVPDEVVLVKDGPLTEELEAVISKYASIFSAVLRVFSLPKNVGLGRALDYGLQKCSNVLIARMDSDDICAYDRFENQLRYFQEHPGLDVLGSNIVEFYESPNSPVFVKKLPGEMSGILKMMKRRNPINHVSVMFKKESVIRAGGYLHLPYLEDYYLWVRMANINCSFKNMDSDLVFVRTGKEMYKRRGNREYISSWYKLQKVMKVQGQISLLDLVINMCNIFVFTYLPPAIKQHVYRLFLRQSKFKESIN